MAEATLAPPATPPAGVKIANPLPAPKMPPAPTREIRLGSPAPSDRGPGPNPPSPSSARAAVSQQLYKKAGVTSQAPAPVTEPPASPPEVNEEVPAPESDAAPEAGEVTPAETPSATPADKKKVNPWKLLKEVRAELEAERAGKAKAAPVPEEEKKGYLTRIEELEKHNKRLESEMQFVSYEQSAEFKRLYDKPYQDAFKAAWEDIGELVITDPDTREQRKITQQDILNIASMDLAAARQYANQTYGDFADDIMAHRKEIVKNWKARAQALAEAKEKGSERIKQATAMLQKQQQELKDHITSTWERETQSIPKDPEFGKYFTPVEGDQDGNQRLAKGYELVDRAFNENPQNPELKPEERAAIIKRHAVVRARAAGFGRMRAWYEAAAKERDELKKELSKYKDSTPPTGGAPAPEITDASASATSRMMGALRKVAK